MICAMGKGSPSWPVAEMLKKIVIIVIKFETVKLSKGIERRR
jgi:hypothetical protein